MIKGNIDRTIFEIANWFLSKGEMTHKKLQKLTYYYKAWGYALYDRDMIPGEAFEAWVHGPVSRKLYDEYKSYGWNEIEKTNIDITNFSDEELNLLESIWVTYGDETANSLEALTHNERPWQEARLGLDECENSENIISPKTMKEYYQSIYLGD